MSSAAKSLFVYGIYILALSIFLIVAPNLFLSLFGFPTTNEVWLRVAGLLLLYLGFYDVQAARAELKVFFKWSFILGAQPFSFSQYSCCSDSPGLCSFFSAL